MAKNVYIEDFIDEIYKNPPTKNYSAQEIVYNHFDELWFIDLLDVSDYKISNKKEFS